MFGWTGLEEYKRSRDANMCSWRFQKGCSVENIDKILQSGSAYGVAETDPARFVPGHLAHYLGRYFARKIDVSVELETSESDNQQCLYLILCTHFANTIKKEDMFEIMRKEDTHMRGNPQGETTTQHSQDGKHDKTVFAHITPIWPQDLEKNDTIHLAFPTTDTKHKLDELGLEDEWLREIQKQSVKDTKTIEMWCANGEGGDSVIEHKKEMLMWLCLIHTNPNSPFHCFVKTYRDEKQHENSLFITTHKTLKEHYALSKSMEKFTKTIYQCVDCPSGDFTV